MGSVGQEFQQQGWLIRQPPATSLQPPGLRLWPATELPTPLGTESAPRAGGRGSPQPAPAGCTLRAPMLLHTCACRVKALVSPPQFLLSGRTVVKCEGLGCRCPSLRCPTLHPVNSEFTSVTLIPLFRPTDRLPSTAASCFSRYPSAQHRA